MASDLADQCLGCLLGLATGDAMGAPFEGGPLERFVWKLLGRTADGRLRWTDDTQMTIDLTESLLEHDGLNLDALAKRFAESYRWSRGYGAGAAKLLKRIRKGESWQQASTAIYEDGSYGNGAAMRAAVLALFYPNDQLALIAAARDSARITHAHPLGIDGAVLLAVAAHGLLNGWSRQQLFNTLLAECQSADLKERIKTVQQMMEQGNNPTPRELARKLGNGITVLTSCPTALYIALRHIDLSFTSMMDFIIACRGDVDTIGAMAGGIWGITNGPSQLPPIRLEGRERLIELANRINRRHHNMS